MDAKQKFIEKKIAKLSKQWDWAYELIDTILADQMLWQYDWKAAIQTAHDTYGVPLVQEMSNTLKVPALYKKAGVLSSRYHLDIHRAMELNHKTLVDKLEHLGAYRDPYLLQIVLMAGEADSKGRLGYEDREYPQRQYMSEAAQKLKELKFADLAETYQGQRLLDAIRARKTNAMKAFKKQWNTDQE